MPNHCPLDHMPADTIDTNQCLSGNRYQGTALGIVRQTDLARDENVVEHFSALKTLSVDPGQFFCSTTL